MISPKKIVFNGKSNEDFELICDLCFEGGDNGETSSFLSRKAVKTETYNGAFSRSYGMKYDEVFAPQITLMKRNFDDFDFEEQRAVLAWLTSKHTTGYMDVYMTNDDVAANSPSYCLLGGVTKIETYKLGNNRTVGIIFTFESLHPYALSPIQTVDNKYATTLTITCNTDDPGSFVYPKLTIYFNKGQDFTITRIGDGNKAEQTIIKENIPGETIIIDSANKIITSDRTVSRFFGDNFNWVWPKLTYGDNKFSVSPIPKSSNAPLVTFKYRYPIKCGQF